MRRKAAILPRFVLLLGLSLVPVAAAFGQERVVTYQGGLGLTAASFAGRPAGAGGSVGVHLAAEPRLFRVVAVRVEGGVEYLGPLCFEAGEACEAERRRSSSSDTFMLSGSAALGMFTPPLYLGGRSEGVDVAMGVFAGREWIDAGLGRGDCLNCRASGIDLRGGLYVEPALELWFFQDVGLGASYRVYQTASDLRRRFTVRFIVRGA